MKSRSSTFWLYIFLIGFLVVLGLTYVFQPTAFERLPWPWLLIFFCPLLMFFMGHGNHAKDEKRGKKSADDADHLHQ
jgi:hypothetical protein